MCVNVYLGTALVYIHTNLYTYEYEFAIYLYAHLSTGTFGQKRELEDINTPQVQFDTPN